MKNISPALQNFLLLNTTFNRADLYTIQLPNGTTLNAVSGTNTDIVFPGSQGPLSPVTVTTSGSGNAWNNTTGVTGTVSFTSTNVTAVTSPTSDLLNCENFGFSIPSTIGSIIGVQVQMVCYCSISGSNINPSLTGQLLVGGSPVGTAQAFNMPGLPEFYFPTRAITLQISNLLYPGTLTAAQVNASNFGIQVQANCTGTSGMVTTVQVQYMQVTVTWQGGSGTTVFYASQNGVWERGPYKNEASFRISSQDMELTALIPESVDYPGTTTPFMQVVNQGMLEGALVNIQTLYWPDGQLYTSGLNMGTMQLTNGQIGNVKKTGRSKVTCQLYDLLYILNRNVPPFKIMTSCRHTFCDAGCTLNPATFTSSNTLATGSTTLYLNLTTTPPSLPFTLGYVTFTSGQNAGLKASIKAVTVSGGVTTFQLLKPLPFPVATGDVLDITSGCLKSISACNFYSNIIHYGGQPFVPNPEVAE
jgi:hypothetical protein